MEPITIILGITVVGCGAYAANLKSKLNDAYASIKLLDAQYRKVNECWSEEIDRRVTLAHTVSELRRKAIEASRQSSSEPMKRSSPRSYPSTKDSSPAYTSSDTTPYVAMMSTTDTVTCTASSPSDCGGGCI